MLDVCCIYGTYIDTYISQVFCIYVNRYVSYIVPGIETCLELPKMHDEAYTNFPGRLQ